MMAANYKEAFLNISADAAADARGGCFIDRDPADVATLRIAAPKISKSWWLVPDARYQFDWMDDAASFSRAWIHRERQLSRRILHFTEKEIIFECCSAQGYRSETFPGGTSFKRLFNRETKFQIGGLDNKSTAMDRQYDPKALSVYETWSDVCETLSSKFLTVPSDMPVVLSSLAEEFASRMPSSDRFLAGLWESTLPESLLWNIQGFIGDECEYIAPSWSWMSGGRAVVMTHRYTPESRTKVTVADVVGIETRLLYENQPYGPLASGILTVNGIMRRIKIKISDNHKDFDLSVDDDLETPRDLRLIGHSWDEYKGNNCILRVDGTLRSLDLDFYALFIKYEQWKHSNQQSERELTCLLLAASGDGTLQRRGTLTLHDRFALKMRYRVARHESSVGDDDFAVMLHRIQRVNDHRIGKEQKLKRDGAQAAQDEDDLGGKDRPSAANVYKFDVGILPGYEQLFPRTIRIA